MYTIDMSTFELLSSPPVVLLLISLGAFTLGFERRRVLLAAMTSVIALCALKMHPNPATPTEDAYYRQKPIRPYYDARERAKMIPMSSVTSYPTIEQLRTYRNMTLPVEQDAAAALEESSWNDQRTPYRSMQLLRVWGTGKDVINDPKVKSVGTARAPPSISLTQIQDDEQKECVGDSCL